MNLEEELFEFLRHGDEDTLPPDHFGLRMDLGKREHEYLAKMIAAWIERREIRAGL
ncbi:hypothetical protein LCGC14_0798420 [marine sediment metagenome]|uniref:Uncharacterized protein n=1 Tax=marine sediment metagenome TaxID=412755 RepID=A0A0F9PQA7_9ZZZZ